MSRMSTAIYPRVASAAELLQKRQEAAAAINGSTSNVRASQTITIGIFLAAMSDRELQWLLESVRETLESLREGVEECRDLIAPSESGSTLAVSTHLSEAVKGFITRSGTSLIKGSISLNLPTLPNSPTTHTIASPYGIPTLAGISSLLSDSALLIGTMLETQPLSAHFVRDQLRLLSEILTTISNTLAGTDSPEMRLTERLPSTPSTSPPLFIRTATYEENLSASVLPPSLFEPKLPPQICLTLAVGGAAAGDPSFVLTARTLAAADAPALSIRERLGLAQVPRHDESGADVLYGERQVRVREKLRVPVSDPGMVSLAAKICAMARVVGSARGNLEAVLESVGSEGR